MTARGRLRVAIAGTLAAVAVLSTALAAVATGKDSHTNGAAAARINALAAAQHDVAVVLSYDYRELQRDFAAAEASLTPSFRKKYVATTTKAVTPAAAKYKVIVRAVVTASGSMTATARSASVLVFVQQTTTNTQLTAPRLDRSRIIVDLVKSGDRWLINNLHAI